MEESLEARRYKSRRLEEPQLDISALASEDNHFEWDPVLHCCDDVSKKLLCHRMKKFKNNEPVVKSDDDKNSKISYFLDIDICDEFSNTEPKLQPSTRQASPNTAESSFLPNVVSP